MAEKYYSISPYAYCANNPVKFIDVDGNDITIYYESGFTNGSPTYSIFVFNGHNRAQSPNNAYVQNFIKAYDYDVNNGGGDNLSEAAFNRKLNIKVTDAQGGMGYGDEYLKGYVYWNPYDGQETENGLFESPATILEHEFDHAVDDAKHPNEHTDRVVNTYDEKYDNDEEKRVITGSEKKTATANGEIKKGQVNSSHHAKTYRTTSPTSTEEAGKQKKTQTTQTQTQNASGNKQCTYEQMLQDTKNW